MKIVLPVSSMPAIAAMTVRPEIRTARPEVAAAMSIASSLPRALGALLTLAADVEQRVVDADREADEHDRRHARCRRSARLAGERDDAGGAERWRSARGATGTAAATSAPKVSGEDEQRDAESDMICELPSSALAASSSCLVMLASPNCSTAMPGWRAATGSVASRIGWTRSIAVSGSPLRSNWTSAEWPSLETVSVVTLATTRLLADAGLATSSTAALKAGSSTVLVLLWTSTISPDFFGKPASSRIVSARRVSPSIFCASVGVFWPSDAADDERDHDEREPSEDGGLAVPGTPVPGPGGDALGLGERHGGFTSPGGSRLVRRGSAFRAPFSAVAPGVCGVLQQPTPGYG